MQPTFTLTAGDLSAIRARGAAIRKAGGVFWSNPYLADTKLELEDWAAAGYAWGAGWLEQDAGQTPEVQRVIDSMSVLPRR